MQQSARTLRECMLACAILSQACMLDETPSNKPAAKPLSVAAKATSSVALGLDFNNAGSSAPPSAAMYYQPAARVSWQIQLQGALDPSVPAQLFDVDLFDTSEQQIDALHARGAKVICYFDTAYEDWRPDAWRLEPRRGNPIKGWPGQYWLDVTDPRVVEVMMQRIALASRKGCDGVDADDVDSVGNDPGTPTTREDQRAFVIKLANAAHDFRLAFGLKNALEDVPSLHTYADFAVNEQCLQYNECERLKPFIDAGKPVLHIEYAAGALESGAAAEVCARGKALGFSTLIKHMDLAAARYACP